MAAGQIDAGALVDLTLPLREYRTALASLREAKAGTFKAVLTPRP